ncbi:metallophosphoesterase [Luteolibacter flavescens]|uniref:Metallophosphoesterase n=1 Tax=Luteolibacter flavescens TaxID=1859460 RepID=A0ABT3FQ53_9BACT|nr:metallophosphoesterase [Luteolibacter flavescens]MCW1885449.1 metallophosphoesterase [Luteolibacter flavescens]
MNRHSPSNSNPAPHPMSRREALRTTLLFSSGILTGGLAGRLAAAPDGADKGAALGPGGIDLLAVGDYGTNNDKQRQVARQMAAYAGALGRPLSCVLALGDNFYGKFMPEEFPARFSAMYPKKDFNCPFYATLGNHDYGPSYDSKQGRLKADYQLARTRQSPGSRWKMPAKWYAFELPGKTGKPLVKVIYLDGNNFEGALTPQEKLAQRRWLAAEMAKPTAAKWLWMVSHYPIFSETKSRGDAAGSKLLEQWGPYLKDGRVSLYLAGHDHNLQHLRVEGYSPDFVVSGGGGASRYEVVPGKGRGFCMQTRGFNHIHVTEEKMTVQFINPDGKRIHAYEREVTGKMRVLEA